MLNKFKKSNTEGFTIIEVMIVLAIAGLILLVVLLAVPALQRNARNTTMKNDASAIAGGITEYESNNNGALPTAAQSTYAGGVLSLSAIASDPGKTTAKVQGSDAVTYHDATVPETTAPTPGSLDVYFKYTCSGTLSNRAVAVVYTTETAGSKQLQCLDT